LQQIVVTVVLIALLGGLAGYFAWRQIQTLRDLREDDNLPSEDRRYFRRQAWRRLVGCGLMMLLLGLFGGTFFFEGAVAQFAEERQAAREQGPEPEFSPEQRLLMKFYGGYWIAILLLVLGLVGIAFVDLLAIRRYGQRHFRKLQEDRRAMIERQVARLRQERNGHH
jgi:hypothetical protein